MYCIYTDQIKKIVEFCIFSLIIHLIGYANNDFPVTKLKLLKIILWNVNETLNDQLI